MKRSKYIDHTLLKPESTQADIEKICEEAIQYDFASVMVNPYWIPFCAKKLEGTGIMPCCVIGFPLGANTTATKVFEAKEAIQNGAQEIDMVMNIGELKGGNDQAVLDDMKAVVEAANGTPVKVILETCLLTDEEITKACKIALEAGVTFVKTSTGFSTEGANVHVVKVMKEAVGDACQVKASGGVRTPEEMDEMIEAGATRIGTSKGISLM